MANGILLFPEVEGYLNDLSRSAGVSGGVSFARGKTLDGTEYSLGARNFYDSSRFFYLKELWGEEKVVCGSSDIQMLMGHLKEEFKSDPGMMQMFAEAEQMLGIGDEELGHGKMCKCKVCGTEIDLEDEEGLWGHLQLEHEELFEECMDWETPYMIEEYYDVVSLDKEMDYDEEIGEVLTLEAARKDIVEYLGQQEDEYFSERGTTKEQVLQDQVLIETLAVEHMRCVNRYGNEREWSCKDACDVEPGFYLDMKQDLIFVEAYEEVSFYEDADGNRFQQIQNGEPFPVVDGEMQYKDIYTLGNYTLKYNLNGVAGFTVFKGNGVLETGVWNLKEAVASLEEFYGMDKKPGLSEQIKDAESKGMNRIDFDFPIKEDPER